MLRVKPPAFVHAEYSDNVARTQSDYDSSRYYGVYTDRPNTTPTQMTFAHRAFNTISNVVDRVFGDNTLPSYAVRPAPRKKKLTDFDYDRLLHE